ncbi:MAG: hypothetical protein GXO78_10430 [Calditrichaeota bacterium]|nr:hypothetical protein [Calditrichota bacterium]
MRMRQPLWPSLWLVFFLLLKGGAQVIPIAEIQQNESQYLNQQVTIRGVVVLGAGITTTSWTDAYVQDTSNAGINIYRPGSVDPKLVRGNLVEITGTVENYQGVTEITNYSVTVIRTNEPLPPPVKLTTQQANNVEREGTFVEVTGEITSRYVAGSGTNLVVNDGSGECTVRVWNSTGVDLSEAQVGKTVTIRGPLDIYRGNTQILLAYQEDLIVRESRPGDGTGVVTVDPDSVAKGATDVSLTFTIQAEDPYILESISIWIPELWEWSFDVNDVSLEGAGLSGARSEIEGRSIVITGAEVGAGQEGVVRLFHLNAPDSHVTSVFQVKTAVWGGVLAPIKNSPRIVVGEGIVLTPISEIQLLSDQYLGKQVNIKAVVVLGAGITTTGWTDAYVQDNSGYGINVFRSGEVDSRLKRGRLVIISGVVDEYQGVTEITDYTLTVLKENVPLPPPLKLQTLEATDVKWEGTFVEVQGRITQKYTAGSGVNLNIDDGSGPCLVRVWNSTGIDLSPYNVEDTVVVRGPMDIYQGNAQILLGYEDDIFKPGEGIRGDGSGFARVDLQSVRPDSSGIALQVVVWGGPDDTLHTVQVYVPVRWGWSNVVEDLEVSGSGAEGAAYRVVQEFDERFVEVTGAQITATDNVILTFRNMSSPPDSVYSYVWVKTAVEGGVPRFIAESPRIQVGRNPVYQIFDLQLNSGYFLEKPVTVEGVMTIGAGVLRTDRTAAYLQDASRRGIQISSPQPPDTTVFRRYYRLRVSGVVSEYRQTTQLEPIQVTVLDSLADLPEPFYLSTRNANDPRWDGTYIQVHGVVTDKYTTSSSPPFDYNVVVNDGSGGITVRIWGTTGIDVDFFSVNDALFVTGVGGVFVDRNNVANYQILPGYRDQVVRDENYRPSLANVNLWVPPHPFVPERGEKIAIRYNASAVGNRVTLRIFDLGGRLITTLVDEDARLIERTVYWDGRNDLRDLVPLGTYICHLEVVEPIRSEKRTRMVPIVVGTVLNRSP